MNLRKFIPLAVILALATMCIPPAHGDAMQTHYQQLRTLPAKSLDAVSTADIISWTTPLRPVATLGNPTVTSYVSFGNAGATATLECGLYFKNDDGSYTYLGAAGAKVTATGAASGNVDGALYPALDRAKFDTGGAPYYDLRVTTISAGTVTVRPWIYGAKSQ